MYSFPAATSPNEIKSQKKFLHNHPIKIANLPVDKIQSLFRKFLSSIELQIILQPFDNFMTIGKYEMFIVA